MACILRLAFLLLAMVSLLAMPPKRAVAASKKNGARQVSVSANNTRCELPSSPVAPSSTLASPRRTPAAQSPAAQRKAEIRAAKRAAETAAETTKHNKQEAQRKAATRAGNSTLTSPTTRAQSVIRHCLPCSQHRSLHRSYAPETSGPTTSPSA